jgi:hypothetical protein
MKQNTDWVKKWERLKPSKDWYVEFVSEDGKGHAGAETMIKAFIQAEIDKAVKRERDRIEEWAGKRIGSCEEPCTECKFGRELMKFVKSLKSVNKKK